MKIRSCNLTVFSCFRHFRLQFLRKYVEKVSHLRKLSFPFGIFLNSYMKIIFDYFFGLT